MQQKGLTWTKLIKQEDFPVTRIAPCEGMFTFLEKLDDVAVLAQLTSSITFILKVRMRVLVASKKSDFFNGEKSVV